MKSRHTLEKGLPFISSSRNPEADHPFRQSRGFTLVELMVVIAILVVIASIAIPAAIRARVQSNEAAAIGNLRTLSSAAEAYRSGSNPSSYAPDISTMITSKPAYIDSSWGNGQRQGYSYTYIAAGNGETFSCAASPLVPNASGINSYCVDHSGVIRRYSSGGNLGSEAGCDRGGTPI